MTNIKSKTLTVFAPAKINLYLHVNGKRDDGYHLIESLVVFADIGDTLRFSPADEFGFTVDGPFARAFSATELDATGDSGNLVVRAVWALADMLGRTPDFKISLTKNVPLAAGIGGGSSDAAAAVWGMLEWWDMPVPSVRGLPGLLLELGADVPVCMACQPAHFTGVGEIIDTLPAMEEMAVVIVHPGKACSTAEVFKRFKGPYHDVLERPYPDGSLQELVEFLNQQDNDLTAAAGEIVPDINDMIETLAAQPGCLLARMSGSGAACFGLFVNEDAAMNANEDIVMTRPEWWVRCGTINRPQRY